MIYFQNYFRKSIIFLIPLCCFFFISCHYKREVKTYAKGIKYLTIDPDGKFENIPVSSISNKLRVVSLETTKNCLFDSFTRLIYYDDHHIIFKTKSSILIFGGDGKYLSKISRWGRGPEEYQLMTNVFVEPKEARINILDNRLIKTYNYTGDFLYKKELPFLISGMNISGGELIASVQQRYNEVNRTALYIFDKDLSIIRKYKSKNNAVLKKGFNQRLFFAVNPYVLDGEVYFLEPFVDTIYHVGKRGLTSHWVLDYKKETFSLEEVVDVDMSPSLLSDKISPLNLKESTSFFFVDYIYKEAKHLGVFDKEKKKYIFFQKYTREEYPEITAIPPFGLTNDLLKNAPTFWPDYISDSLMISVTAPFTLSQEQKSIFGCKDGDNPLLFIAKESS